MSLHTDSQRMAAPEPSFTHARPARFLQRKCACGGTPGPDGECAACKARRLRAQRQAGQAAPAVAPPIVHEVLRAPGQPLDAATRAFMEPRLGHSFGSVRVHADAQAAASARAVNALAYTVGRNVVFGTGQYRPETPAGRRLLAHELTHVVQQGSAPAESHAQLMLNQGGDRAEREADRAATRVDAARLAPPASVPGAGLTVSRVPAGSVQRQLITPHAVGGGFGGLMERDRRIAMAPPAATPAAGSPFKVCARDLQGVLGYIGNHAYIEAPPYRYAIISPLCPASGWDNPVTGTTAQKWDNSPDPCGKTPHCVDCVPAAGVTDLGRCFRDAFTAYNNPSLYRGLGPNSNTFAGTLARTCCSNMVPKPAALGNVPAWNDAPAPARRGATPCPPGPTC